MKHNEKSNLYRFLKPWLQDGLLVSKGSKWQQRRKILTSAFHFNVLQKYFVTMKDNDKALIESLKKSNGEPVDIVSTMTEYTLNTICESAMGIKLREKESELGKSYKNAIYSLGKDLVKRFSNIFIHPDITFYSTILGIRQTKYLNTIHSFTKSIIQKRKEALNNYEVSDENNNEEELGIKKKRTAMLDLLLSAQKHGIIDDKGIQEEVDTFMFEGHDTTAAGLTYAILLLANHSDIQNKIVEELHGIFGNDDRDATMDDLAAMKYLELCLKESMRLYPPVPFIMRQITQPCKLSNFEIPKNTLCSIHIYDLHRNEIMFPDPHKFNPERFLPENSVGRHNYAYIPFSAGPRNCIGQKFAMMEMKSSVSSILRNFELLPVTKPSDIVFIADIVLRNTEPIYVRFVPRR
ncbi:cytochrome P450 4C1-like isoform X2 [Aricia agestis]|nr:cytochrome P450 4C1-like isoform X2 [Aricia agestis]